MAQQQYRERQDQRDVERAHEHTAERHVQNAPVMPAARGALVPEAGGGKPTLKPTRRKATAGKAGEAEIRIAWVPVSVGNHTTVVWKVATAPGNELDVVVEQATYKKKYRSTGALETQVLPIAPLGTECRITVRDIATNEEVIEEGVWRTRAASFFAALVKLIKGLVGIE